MRRSISFRLCDIAAFFFCFSTLAFSASPRFFPELFGDAPAVINVKAPQYGARGDGATDDTAAVQKALDAARQRTLDVNGRWRKTNSGEAFEGRDKERQEKEGKTTIVLFPEGEYLISAPLRLDGAPPACYLTVIGEDRERTILRLTDNSPAFGDPRHPSAVFSFTDQPSSNISFENRIQNLTIDAGRGNPAAIGLDYISNNGGNVEYLTLRAGEGSGAIGLKMDRKLGGVSLLKHIRIEGFETGVLLDGDIIGYTFEHLSLAAQRKAGMEIANKPVQALRLTSDQSATGAPAIVLSDPGAHLVLIDSELAGASPAQAAILNREGWVYLRRCAARGYAGLIEERGAPVAGNELDEYISGEALALFENASKTGLGLEIPETPEPAWPASAADWAIVDGAALPPDSHVQAIQQAIDSGKRNVLLRPACYRLDAPIEIRGAVERIHAAWSTYSVSATAGDDQTIWHFAPSLDHPVVLMGMTFQDHGSSKTDLFRHDSPVPVVLKDIRFGGAELAHGAGVGPLFVENLTGGGRARDAQSPIRALRAGWALTGIETWIRALNVEGFADPHFYVDGGQCWLMGFKFGENSGPFIAVSGGARVEVLGGLLNGQNANANRRAQWLVECEDSDLWLVAAERIRNQANWRPHPYLVAETVHGEQRRLAREQAPVAPRLNCPAAIVPGYRSAPASRP